jgi:hypothetical protein
MITFTASNEPDRRSHKIRLLVLIGGGRSRHHRRFFGGTISS